MHFFDSSVERRGRDFKTAMWESIHEHSITQEDIASELGVAQSAVSRWMSPNGDLHFPLSLLPELKSPKLRPLQMDMLNFIATECGCVITERPTVVGLNGRLDDEVIDLAASVGRMADRVRTGRTDAKKALADIRGMRAVLNRAEAELEAHHAA